MKSQYILPAAADFHVHLRSGAMSEAVVPTIRQGGVNTVYVMPNLVPPVTSIAAALEYREKLRALDSSVEYLMTLYLHQNITPSVIREASKAGGGGVIVGVKSYPAGVTTNSSSGVLDYEFFFPVFAAMEEEGMVLNLHGEHPSDHASNVTILNAEASFLPTLKMLHAKFPKLKIVLEHCTTEAAINAVLECGHNVVGTLTAHHLFLVVDDWAGDVFNFCKPVAKLPSDRLALLRALVSSKGKFFLGTDSAPHDLTAKKMAGPGGKTAAGVFTQPYAVPYVFTALEEAVERGDVRDEDITQELLEGFLSGFGRKFYGVPAAQNNKDEKIIVTKTQDELIAECVRGKRDLQVVPFRAGQKGAWKCEWQKYC